MSEPIDPFSPEADALLERHRLEALQVAKIATQRAAIQRRNHTANRMARKLATLAQDLYDFARDGAEVEEAMESLGQTMQEDGLTAAQRRDIWAWVAAADETWGWG